MWKHQESLYKYFLNILFQNIDGQKSVEITCTKLDLLRLLFGDISWYQESKEPGEPQESGFSPSSLLQSFRHFPYNATQTRVLKTTSLKCCLPPTDAIDRRENIHVCVWRFKVVSCKRASLKSTRFSQKKVWYFSNRGEFLLSPALASSVLHS